MHCTVSCWILEEHSDREGVSRGINLTKTWHVQPW
jgi:hypothetical protein